MIEETTKYWRDIPFRRRPICEACKENPSDYIVNSTFPKQGYPCMSLNDWYAICHDCLANSITDILTPYCCAVSILRTPVFISRRWDYTEKQFVPTAKGGRRMFDVTK